MSGGTAPRTRRGWPLVAVIAPFALLYGYDLAEAVTNLVLVPREVALSNEVYGVDSPVPWSALAAGVLTPVLAFIAALRLGRGRAVTERAVILLLGLCVVAAVTLSLTAYVRAGGL